MRLGYLGKEGHDFSSSMLRFGREIIRE